MHLPLQVDPSDHLRREVHPTAPDAWIDDSRTRVGCEISPALFYQPELDGECELLRAQDLHEVDSAVELPDTRMG